MKINSKNIHWILLGLVMALFFPLPVAADLIDLDFRTDDFGGAGSASYTTTMNGLDLTISANTNGALLWRDSWDGYGIQYDLTGIVYDYIKDEIQGAEILNISFSEPVNLYDVSITNLYNESGYYEMGLYSINGGKTWTNFHAQPDQLLGYSYGRTDILIDAWTDSILFSAPGIIADQNHDFSIGGISFYSGTTVTLDPVPTPVPSAILLLASGIFGMGLFQRKAPKIR